MKTIGRSPSVERRAPGDTGVKLVKRKRSRRPAVAVEAQIKRGYPQVLSKTGSTACQQRNQSNHVDARGTDRSSHPAADHATSATRDDGNDSPSMEVTWRVKFRVQRRPLFRNCLELSTQELMGRPDEFVRDPMKCTDWFSKL